MLNFFQRAGLASAMLLVAEGCDSSTGPGHPSAQAIARHFDSLMVQAESLHTNNGDARAATLWRLELAPALGARPVDVTVTTSSGTKQWQGFMWKSTAGGLQLPGDTLLTLAVYSDDNVTNAIFAQTDFGSYQPITLFGALAADTVPLSAYESGATLETVSLGGGCEDEGGLSYPFSRFIVSGCQAGTFQGGVSFTSPITSGPLADYQTVTIAPRQFNGVWVK